MHETSRRFHQLGRIILQPVLLLSSTRVYHHDCLLGSLPLAEQTGIQSVWLMDGSTITASRMHPRQHDRHRLLALLLETHRLLVLRHIRLLLRHSHGLPAKLHTQVGGQRHTDRHHSPLLPLHGLVFSAGTALYCRHAHLPSAQEIWQENKNIHHLTAYSSRHSHPACLPALLPRTASRTDLDIWTHLNSSGRMAISSAISCQYHCCGKTYL